MKEQDSQAIILVGLGFGDEGKGGFVDFLSRELPVHTIVRFNGGVQAAHSVLTPDGRYHKFRQFGSGMLVPGVKTHLSKYMLVEPAALFKEARDLKWLGVIDPFSKLTIDQEAVVVTPYHQASNRLKVLASGKNTSCGLGNTEAVLDFNNTPENTLFIKDLESKSKTSIKLKRLREVQLGKILQIENDLPKNNLTGRELKVLNEKENIFIFSEFYKLFAKTVQIIQSEEFSKSLKQPGVIIFEGSQGVLLDPDFGFKPYTTSTKTTPENALKILSENNFQGQKTVIGALRAYSTRHGDGPFITEDNNLSALLQDVHNPFNNWQGKFRVGYFDLLMAKYAIKVSGQIDCLALSHIDQLKKIPEWKVANGYLTKENQLIHELPISKLDLTNLLAGAHPIYNEFYTKRDTKNYVDFLERKLGSPISILSSGPSSDDKSFSRKDYQK